MIIIKTKTFYINISCPEYLDDYDFDEITIDIDDGLNDIIKFYYEKHFHEPFKELGWWLLPGAKKFVKEIEQKWLKNEIDCDIIYKDKLMDKIIIENLESNDSVIDNLKSDIKDFLLSKLNFESLDTLENLSDNGDISLDYSIILEDIDSGNQIEIYDYLCTDLESLGIDLEGGDEDD